jgi:hypothetical protein
VTFNSGYAGVKNLYQYANDVFGNSTAYASAGTVSIGSGTPGTGTVTASPGTGLSETFTATYSDTAGATNLSRRMLIIAPSLTTAGACAVFADPNGFYLINDAGNNVMGPLTAAGLSNGQCTLNNSGTGVSNSGNNATVTFSVTFNSGYSGVKNLYLYATDTFGNMTGYANPGTVTIGSGTPSTGTATANPTSGLSTTFTATYSDTAGATSLSRRMLIIASSLTTVASCAVFADPNGFYLINDAGNNVMGPLTAAGLSNGQCTLNNSGTGVSNSGNTATVTFSVTFNGGYTGTKNLYLFATDVFGNSTGYPTVGTFVP